MFSHREHGHNDTGRYDNHTHEHGHTAPAFNSPARHIPPAVYVSNPRPSWFSRPSWWGSDYNRCHARSNDGAVAAGMVTGAVVGATIAAGSIIRPCSLGLTLALVSTIALMLSIAIPSLTLFVLSLFGCMTAGAACAIESSRPTPRAAF